MAVAQNPVLRTIPAGLGTNDYENWELTSTKAAITTSATTLRGWLIDNKANESDVWMKLYDAAVGNVTVGTTVPAVIWRCGAGKIEPKICPEGIAFATAVTGACTISAGTAGTTSPTNPVRIRLHL